MKAGLDWAPNSLASSMASSITTLGGVFWKSSSQMAMRRMDRSVLLIFSKGHLGAFFLMVWSIIFLWERIFFKSLVCGFLLPKVWA